MQQNMIRATMSNGLLLGALFSANFLVSLSKSFIGTILSFAIFTYILLYIYRTSVKNREVNHGGTISYFSALMFIVLSFFYAGIISSIVKYIYFQFINPEYLQQILSEGMRAMETLKLPFDDSQYEQMQNLLKPATFALQYIWMNTILGLLVGLIMSFFIKKEKNIFES